MKNITLTLAIILLSLVGCMPTSNQSKPDYQVQSDNISDYEIHIVDSMEYAVFYNVEQCANSSQVCGSRSHKVKSIFVVNISLDKAKLRG